jgi:DnaK suppressor protein
VDAKRKKELKDLLTEMKESKIAEIRQNTDEMASADGFQNDAQDFADTATNIYDKELHGDLTEKNKKILHNIEEALAKIEEGRFGKCDKCGKDISIERLKAIPSTKLCIKCQTGAEKL